MPPDTPTTDPNPASYTRRVTEKLADIRDHPDRHKHDFEGLQRCCLIMGVLDMRVMDAHEGITGRTNGGRPCDVDSGPCSCGAWH
ncbi:MAG: hypothetical protein EPN91_00245 [Salinibacterium sp.]|nr:MAG: hypothetical protein EPN91_00245 [Salinibacterium sp.]